MKKAFDQTVRDLKRGVNKKVLKVRSVEQKVLDATSNEPWGPHGKLLADIARASRNYHEYQLIMSILWKRINDSGKNWRHVYKALTVLEYMVAYGSESVIAEIIEHAYQLRMLVDFQYIDSSGRDQGNNVRMKCQTLGMLVSDKERLHELRQKADANKDKFQNSSTGSMYRPGSHPSSGGNGERYDDRYGTRNEEPNAYWGERKNRYKDDVRYGDSNSRDADRYGRHDDSRIRSHGVDSSQDGTKSRSSDREREHGADEQSQDQSVSGQNLDLNNSEQNLPSHEDAVGSAESAGSFRDVPTTSSGVAPTMSASLMDSSTDNSLALAPVTSLSSTVEVDTSTNSASGAQNRGFDDPFGHGPFEALPSTDGTQGQNFHNASNAGPELPQQVSQNRDVVRFPGATSTSSGDRNIDILADILPLFGHQHPVSFQPEYPETGNQDVPQSRYQNGEIVSSTLSSSGDPQAHQSGFPAQSGQLVLHPNFPSQFGQPTYQAGFRAHNAQPSSLTAYPNQPAQASLTGFSAQTGSAPLAKDKFETKSTFWTDTLSRGLVNLNISGPKTSPLSDIGVDFDALNRKERRMEKPAATTVTSTVHMGKAMGFGSGVGRAGAGVLGPTSIPMMGAGPGMAGPRPGVTMAGYAGMNQQPMGVGMGMNMAPNMRMGAQMQQPMSSPPGSAMLGGYNPTMGTGNYCHPYGAGYR